MKQQRRETKIKEIVPAKVISEVIEVRKKENKQKCENNEHTNTEECLQEVMERY